MQDRLKFRYFNKYANKMVKPENWQNVDGIYECIKQQVCFDEDIAPLPYDHIGNGLVFMQCTGLKDKNGNLIYELDHIKYKKETYKVGINKFLGITLTNILNRDIIIMDDLILFNCEVISNEFECNTKIQKNAKRRTN